MIYGAMYVVCSVPICTVILASLSISQSAQLLGFLRTTISRVYKEWCEKGKTSSMRQSCGRKCLVDDARGQMRMGRLIQADRRVTLTEITTRYNLIYNQMQQSICEATTRTTLRWMGHNSRRPHRVPLISTTNRKRGYNLQEFTKIAD